MAKISPPEEIHLDSPTKCDDSDFLGLFPKDTDYDRVITSDCDIYVQGEKLLSFRKGFFPDLKYPSQEIWDFFHSVSTAVYGTQRGVVAGRVFTSRPEARLTKGQEEFFLRASKGTLPTSKEEALELFWIPSEFVTKTLKIRAIKRDYPEIAEDLKELEKVLRELGASNSENHPLRKKRREILWSWFNPWLDSVWSSGSQPLEGIEELLRKYISTQTNYNHCHSNTLGALDRNARFPYGRLSTSTRVNYESFEACRNIYLDASAQIKRDFPDRWQSANEVISKVKDPVYNLFGSIFTTATVNYNFQTAYHRDRNNLEGSLAVLSVLREGDYSGHYLVFPELRVAVDIREGDFLAADTQKLLHGNTPMGKLTEDAKRVSLVFYSRGKMVNLDSQDCEKCRREFIRHSLANLKEKSKRHDNWTGVWDGMWCSEEWLQFREQKGMGHCSNTNWRYSSPYENLKTHKVSLFQGNPGEEWSFLEVCPFERLNNKELNGRSNSPPADGGCDESGEDCL